MARTLDFMFGGKSYTVPKKRTTDLANRQPELRDAKRSAVQSVVSQPIFEAVDSMKALAKISVAPENASPLMLLANEFCLSELASKCATVSGELDCPKVANILTRSAQLEVESYEIEAQATDERIFS
jgi:hypothetical protein